MITSIIKIYGLRYDIFLHFRFGQYLAVTLSVSISDGEEPAAGKKQQVAGRQLAAGNQSQQGTGRPLQVAPRPRQGPQLQMARLS